MALTTNLLAYYEFDTNNTTQPDSVASYDATVTGAVYTTSGKLNGAYTYTNDYMTVTGRYGDAITSDGSIAAWINVTTIDSSGGTIVSIGDSLCLMLRSAGNLNLFYYDGSGWSGGEASADLRDSSWHHVVGTKSGTTLTLYVDGSQVYQGTHGGGTVTYSLGSNTLFGKHGNGGTNWDMVNGMIDEVGIWSRTITSAEVSDLYNSDNGLEYPFTSAITYSNSMISSSQIYKTSVLSDGTYAVMGAKTTSSTDYAGGKIDKMAIYDAYLSEIEISGLYSAGKARLYEKMDLRGQLIFKGKIDNANYGVNSSDGFFVDLDGRDYPQMIDRTITGTHVAATADVAVGYILSTYFTEVNLSFWNGLTWNTATYDSATITWSGTVTTFPTTLINYAYEHKKAWTVIKEILERAGLEFYIDYDKSDSKWYLRVFLPETVYQYQDSVKYGENLIGMSEYGVDTTELVNKSIIYGKTEADNILLMKTEEDENSQTAFWIKDSVIEDGSLVTMDDVQDKANFELSQGLAIPANGRVQVVGLTRIRPGNLMNVSVPLMGVTGRHKITSFTHNIGGGMFGSNIELAKKIKTVKDLFVDAANPDDFTSGFSNPNDMTDSYTVFFDEDPSVMTHSSTAEVSGRLALTGTEVSGEAYADYKATDRDVNYCELRRYESYSVVNDTYEVTNDGGSSWETYSTASGNLHEFSAAGGTVSFKLKLSRTTGTDTSPAYESISMLYKE